MSSIMGNTLRADLAPPLPRPPLTIAGLDLGQTHDFTALAVVERTETREGERFVRRYAVRGLKRWPLRTEYTAVAKDAAALFERPELTGAPLCIDATGVGAPVVEIIREKKPKARLVPFVITGGQHAQAEYEGRQGWKVPKRELASVLQALLGTRRLKASPALPDFRVLTRELQTFSVKINLNTGSESFEAWREKDHDDMVLAVAIAAWFGEKGNRRLEIW
jgi:hypothetical protein